MRRIGAFTQRAPGISLLSWTDGTPGTRGVNPSKGLWAVEGSQVSVGRHLKDGCPWRLDSAQAFVGFPSGAVIGTTGAALSLVPVGRTALIRIADVVAVAA